MDKKRNVNLYYIFLPQLNRKKYYEFSILLNIERRIH